MSPKPLASWSFLLATVLIGAGCGGSDADLSTAADDAVENTVDGAAAVETDPAELDDEAPDAKAAAGFGELMEGAFILSGATQEGYYVSDADLGFVAGGGCGDGQFGFSIAVTDATAETTFALFNAQLPQDLSGGVIGEFDAVEAAVRIVGPGGDMSLIEGYEGPVKMIISEHNTGGIDFELNERRMTITLLGTVTGDNGDVDVDVTFRWVMGCP